MHVMLMAQNSVAICSDALHISCGVLVNFEIDLAISVSVDATMSKNHTFASEGDVAIEVLAV